MPTVDFTQFDHVPEREEAEAETETASAKSTGVDTELKWD
jgi:hypothetical protein